MLAKLWLPKHSEMNEKGNKFIANFTNGLLQIATAHFSTNCDITRCYYKLRHVFLSNSTTVIILENATGINFLRQSRDF